MCGLEKGFWDGGTRMRFVWWGWCLVEDEEEDVKNSGRIVSTPQSDPQRK